MNINKKKTTKEYKKRKKIGQFFTESKLVDTITEKFNLDFIDKIIVEPSCGDGVFIDKIKSYKNCYKQIIGIDIDKSALYKIEKKDEDNITLKHSDFLKCSFKNDIDMIIGNPPFNLPDDKYVDSTEAFFTKGIDILKPGGELILIVPNTVLRIQKYEKLREKILSETKIISILNTSSYEFLGADIETIAIYLKKERVEKQEYSYITNVGTKKIFLTLNNRKTILLSNKNTFNDIDKKINGKELGDLFYINRGHYTGDGLKGRNIDFYNDFINMNNGNDLFIAVQNIAYRIVANVIKGNINYVNDTITILKPKNNMTIDELKYITNFLNSSIVYYNLHTNCLNNCRLTVHIDKYYIYDIKVPIDFNDESIRINNYIEKYVKTKELSKIRNELFYQKYDLNQSNIIEIEEYWKNPKFKLKETVA